MSPAAIIAATFGADVSEVRDGKYQERDYRSPFVFVFADDYWACSKTKPKHDGLGAWEQHTDQFFAGRAGTILWRARC